MAYNEPPKAWKEAVCMARAHTTTTESLDLS